GLDLAAQADAEAHGIGRVADPDLLFQPGAQVHQPDRAVEHQVDRVAETGFAGYFHTVLLPRGAVPGAPGARRALAAVYPSRSRKEPEEIPKIPARGRQLLGSGLVLVS